MIETKCRVSKSIKLHGSEPNAARQSSGIHDTSSQSPQISVKKYGVPETLEAWLKTKHRSLKSYLLMQTFKLDSPAVCDLLVFARERWTGLKSPLRGPQSRN